MKLKEYFKKYTKQSKKGFTLVEVITVVIIMSILSTASVSVVLAIRDTVRDTGELTTDQHRADQIEQFLRNEFQTASKIDVYELEAFQPKGYTGAKDDEFMFYNPATQQLVFTECREETTPSGPVLKWKEKFFITEVKDVVIDISPVNYDSGATGDIPYKMIYKIKTKSYVYSGGIVIGNSYLGDDGVFTNAPDALVRLNTDVSSTNNAACQIHWHKEKNTEDPDDVFDQGIDFAKLQNGGCILFHNEGTQILPSPTT